MSKYLNQMLGGSSLNQNVLKVTPMACLGHLNGTYTAGVTCLRKAQRPTCRPGSRLLAPLQK
ncbi:hypothetical protein CBOM_07684 [Ceraceosorus bombacis]|uniref:Uncharacterized protein n=1 Tax=Ceraceosorus bombacis TaxID=401625 RepID=A0A0P1BLR7_9BASI|nr:hypothetical protein CBOM_07684 [Ceraceosorus bombacis]